MDIEYWGVTHTHTNFMCIVVINLRLKNGSTEGAGSTARWGKTLMTVLAHEVVTRNPEILQITQHR